MSNVRTVVAILF